MIISLGATPALQRSMVFDRLKIDAVNRAAEVVEYASGKAINAARVIHTLGSEVVATGFLGDESGRRVREDLDRAGLFHEFHEVGARTRMCTTLVDRSTSQATELMEEPGQVDAEDWSALTATLRALLHQASMLLLLGSLPPGAPQSFYADCVRLAARSGVRTILDAKGVPLDLALAERPFLIKPNRSELEETTGSPIRCDTDLRAAIQLILSRGPTWAVVTAGPDDTVVSDGTRFWRITPPIVRAVSPIGSGDSFAAGIAVAIADGATVPDACVLGTACAVANALTPLAGHVELSEVEGLRKLIELCEWH